MASDAELSETSLFERLVRHRDLSLFLPFIFGFTRTDPDQETEHGAASQRIILINPFTQGMVVIEGTSSLETLLRDLSGKEGQPPATKASIEAMPSVEIEGDDGAECAICLEEWEAGGVAKEMPCKHRFHGGCIEKWLGIHGSCPVCRYKMPVDEAELGKRTVIGDGDEQRRERRTVGSEIWVSFSINGVRRGGDSNQTTTTPDDSNDSSSSPSSNEQQQMEG